MRTTWGGSHRVGALAALSLVTVCALAPASAPPVSPQAALRHKALALNALTGADPMNRRVDQLVADPAGTRPLLAAARKLADSSPQPFTRNALLVLAQAAGELKEVDTSIAIYRHYLALQRDLGSERGQTSAYRGMLSVYSDTGKYAEAEKLCREFDALKGEDDGAIEREKPLMFNRMVLFIARGGAAERALKIVDDRVRAAPRSWSLRAFRARVLREADKLEDAAKGYLDVIERINRDEKLEKADRDDYVDECRQSLSDVYIDLGQIDRAAEQLKLLLARHPKNASLHNTLGYIWADRGMHLAEAEKMIRKAIELDRQQRRQAKRRPLPEADRDNAAYLDSLGWVLFKQGKVKEAKPHLLEAVKDRDGQNIEIYDHLGDVHMALGEKGAAVAAWKRGLESVSPSKRDQKRKAEVQKKLQQHSK